MVDTAPAREGVQLFPGHPDDRDLGCTPISTTCGCRSDWSNELSPPVAAQMGSLIEAAIRELQVRAEPDYAA